MLIKFDNLASTEGFLPAFLHNKDKYSLNSHLQFAPKHFHVYSQAPTGDIYLISFHIIILKPFNC